MSTTNQGWIKVHRSLVDHPRFSDDGWPAVWVFLLLKATHSEYRVIFAGAEKMLRPGQLITSRKSIASACGLSESKVERILNKLKSDHQIEQQSSSTSRLITILNWDAYQKTEQQSEQQPDSDRTAIGQQPDTNKNVEKGKNVENGEREASRTRTRFVPPSLSEAEAEAVKNGMPAGEGQAFIDHHQAKGWVIGKSPMQDWRAAMRTWKRNWQKFQSNGTRNGAPKQYAPVAGDWGTP